MIVFYFSIAQCDYWTTIKTPTNVSVEAKYRTEGSPAILAALEAYAADWIDDNDSDAVKVEPASLTYNCHNYAWHKSDGGSTRWVNAVDRYESTNINRYWSGATPTYESTSLSKATKVYYSSGDHSAKIRSASEFESKWGPWGRYRHSPSDCPYTSSNLQYYYVPVTGDELICTSKTYSTRNISGATYSWSGSKVSISGSGYSVTATKTSDGYGWIKTSISSPYSGTTVSSEKQEFWAGKPGVQPTWPAGNPTPIQAGIYDYVYIYPDYQEDALGATGRYWTASGAITRLSSPTATVLAVEATSTGTGNFYLYGTNVCGTATTGWHGVVSVSAGKSGGGMKVSPIPADSYIEISFDENELSKAGLLKDDKSYDFGSNPYFRIVDKLGEVKITQKYSSEKIVQINTSQLLPGLYTLQLVLKDKVFSINILVSR